MIDHIEEKINDLRRARESKVCGINWYYIFQLPVFLTDSVSRLPFRIWQMAKCQQLNIAYLPPRNRMAIPYVMKVSSICIY